MKKVPAIYIMASKQFGTLYTGVTSHLLARIYQHRSGLTKGFTARYKCRLLVYYELFADMPSAILREKQLKGGSREQKIRLIVSFNPHWDDLYESII